MIGLSEFHYRLPVAAKGHRPGSHAGLSRGAGQEFAAHARLFDNPDPRSIDLRASLRDARHEWLVRVYRQRASVRIHALVDVSASMHFGARRPKLDVVADFTECLGYSAFRAGDPVGMMAFDRDERLDLYLPPRHSRGAGTAMSERLRRCERPEADDLANTASGPSSGAALARTAERLVNRAGLVFLLSDFHWPLDELDTALDLLAHASVVPMVTWDPAEIEPPKDDALLAVRDAESGARRTLWVGRALREQWRERVAQRRADIDARLFARGIRPFYLHAQFDPDALSRYFLEEIA